MIDSIVDALEGSKEAPDALFLAQLPTNDLGLSERLRKRFGELLAKTPEAGWCAWTGKRWETNHKGEAMARIYAHKTAQAMWDEYNAVKPLYDKAAAAGEEEELVRWRRVKTALLKAIDSAGDSGKTTAMLAQAAPYLAAELGDFDPDPWRIGCANGTLVQRFINEPCLVARRPDGAVEAFAPQSALVQPGARTRLAGWTVTYLGESLYEVLHDAAEGGSIFLAGATESVDDGALKTGLSCKGFTLSLRLYHLDLQLAPHNPAHRMTRIAGVAYDPAAQCPNWRTHMETVLADPADRDFFQRAMGYGLVGVVSSQCFLFIQGKGADGKSTTMRVIDRVLGDYGRMCDPRSWLETKQKSAADASPDMADMAGDTRLLYCEEPPKGSRVNEALLKTASGGARMKARQLHQSLFEFEPRFLLAMAFNDLPRVSGGDDGFWRRMRLIRFRRQFTAAEQLAAGDMVEALVQEGPGILNWLLEGLAAWRKHGLQPHEAMAKDILEYRSMSNPFGEWWRERVVVEAGAKVQNKALYEDYSAYLEQQGVDARERLGSKAFSNQLSSLQISSYKSAGTIMRRGVRLKSPSELEAEQAREEEL